ncbi:2-oxoglutarate dehydrogenase [Paraburkholderia sp. MMS20-SJTN17]|uniref:2-oxoglutarate dehydrogenase n=1 Tax=Paraburkholderia translucens TaxID=2886945 RepID=A0ABS8KCR1_9BURK|nr:2-oxoglutarate dehydrogenase [Paraburkholderia sp. MMS20-SJTN17]MCC8402560.1 2-oxoglutarate dehydrogenase [Paraburkholderia sp. MMS20-SJTN17]
MIMSSIDILRRTLALIVLGVVAGSAHALPPQPVAPVTLPNGGHGVDGPFFPHGRVTAVAPTTGSALQQQAQQRVENRLGANSVFSNGSSITRSQAQSNGLGYIAKHFDEIDTAHSGRVTLNDVRQYLQQHQQ